MTLSLRSRIFLTLAPLLVLLAVLGGAGAWLLYHLGGRIDVILRENYRSVIAMERLNEALERIDSSFQFALVGEEDKARGQYDEKWPAYRRELDVEKHNVTIQGEGELVDQLDALSRRYREQGDAFYRLPAGDSLRRDAYFKGGLLDTFKKIKQVSADILLINQENMKEADRNARRTAKDSLLYFGLGLAAAVVLALLLVRYNNRVLLRPIGAVTRSAQAIGAGNLDQVVPVLANDELGQLADAFNVMARQLRAYRQSSYDRLLRAQRTSQATIDSFPDPVLVIDPQGAVEMANPAAQRLLGVRPQKEGEIVLTWAAPEPLRAPLEKALLHQEPYLPEGLAQVAVLDLGGQEHFFLPRVLPIADPYGNTLGAAVLLLDVTRFRLLDQVKSDLVATVSHELKTPLTSIRLVVHLLLEEAVGPLTPKQTELLLDARDNAERLLTMINNLLDLARIEEGRARLRRANESPALLLRAAAEAVGPRARDKEVTVAVEAPGDLPPVAIDAERMGHALGNLLDNALAHTERGGRITLGAEAADGAVVLSVADTGVGIPLEHLPHLFERFSRVPGQSSVGGTGLGLAIVREIVTAHGGNITCESRPGEGTTFRITLPAAKLRRICMPAEVTRPTPEHFLTLIRQQQRGRLKVYLGFAAGVGKTYEMLQEGQRLKRQGVDVVVGVVETHGRAETAAQVGDLEPVPRRRIEYHGVTLEEMDLDAILKRRPTVVLVDELAHTNAPGSHNAKRYQDVEELLRAGINVISTLNIQHLESLYDMVERTTGVKVKERVPDYVLGLADQLVNVDLSAEDLRDRLKSGKIYPQERIERALTNFFTDENLTRLREMALAEIAHLLDRRRREQKDGQDARGTTERVMVCLSSGSPNPEQLLRKAARLAGRLGAPWYAVYVQTPAEEMHRVEAAVERRLTNTLTLATQLGATTLPYKGADVVSTIAAFAKEYAISQILVGRTRRPWYKRWFGPSFLDRLVQAVEGSDVIVVGHF